MLINWNHKSIRLTGRWDRREDNITSTTTNGSQIEITFSGRTAKLLFDTSTNKHPYPHLWISVDDSAKVEVPLDKIINVEANDDCAHVLSVIMKSSSEGLARWYAPLESVVRFIGVEIDSAGELVTDSRPILEVIGDSITEGVLVETDYTDVADYHERVYQDDACATYAWICAEKLNMIPRPIGFGAVGTLKSGSGEVPNVIESYGYVYDGCANEEQKADVIVIAHGANDAGRTDEEFSISYTKFLRVVRSHNSDAQIFAMSPFLGRFEDTMPIIVDEYNKNYADEIKFISTKGWLPREPIHPLKPGHSHAGGLLAEALIAYGVKTG